MKREGDPTRLKDVLTPKGVIGWDVGVSVLWGSISPTGSLSEKVRKAAKDPDPMDLLRDIKSDVSVQRFFSSQIHFCFDRDRPTEEAVQVLRIMCAQELPSFMTPDS